MENISDLKKKLHFLSLYFWHTHSFALFQIALSGKHLLSSITFGLPKLDWFLLTIDNRGLWYLSMRILTSSTILLTSNSSL